MLNVGSGYHSTVHAVVVLYVAACRTKGKGTATQR